MITKRDLVDAALGQHGANWFPGASRWLLDCTPSGCLARASRRRRGAGDKGVATTAAIYPTTGVGKRRTGGVTSAMAPRKSVDRGSAPSHPFNCCADARKDTFLR